MKKNIAILIAGVILLSGCHVHLRSRHSSKKKPKQVVEVRKEVPTTDQRVLDELGEIKSLIKENQRQEKKKNPMDLVTVNPDRPVMKEKRDDS